MLPFDILRLLLSDAVALESLRGFYGRSLSGWLKREVVGQRTSYIDTLRERLSPQAARRIRFLSSISVVELVRTYQDADLLILPSIWQESYGLPIAEAMACGTAVLASRCGGIPELVEDGVTGVLVPQSDLVSLTNALTELVGNRPALKRMGVAAHERAQLRCPWERSADRLEAIYRQLAERDQVSVKPANKLRAAGGSGPRRWLGGVMRSLRMRS